MSKDNGGPAFPVADPSKFDLPNLDEYYRAAGGMTLRDYFAAKAITGMLASPIQSQSGADMYARDAYTIADAMLLERVKP